MNIVLYTTGCPMCKQIEKIMKDKKISYIECTDKEQMLKLGISFVPAISIDGNIMNTKEAMKWVMKQ